MSGRKQDPIWLNYNRSSANNGSKATCKICNKTMQGIVTRMKNHSAICKSRLILYCYDQIYQYPNQ